MTTSTVVYKGQLRTEAKHLQSGTVIVTDAPVDNHGKGEAFSPTDLVATSLASCMMTIMGIKAESMGINLVGAHAEVTKVMQASPRRIAEIVVVMHLPKALDEKERVLIEGAGNTCPVKQSLHPDTKQSISYVYDV